MTTPPVANAFDPDVIINNYKLHKSVSCGISSSSSGRRLCLSPPHPRRGCGCGRCLTTRIDTRYLSPHTKPDQTSPDLIVTVSHRRRRRRPGKTQRKLKAREKSHNFPQFSENCFVVVVGHPSTYQVKRIMAAVGGRDYRYLHLSITTTPGRPLTEWMEKRCQDIKIYEYELAGKTARRFMNVRVYV